MTKWLVLLVLLALGAALYRSYPAHDGELLYLGSTGIFCVQEPCPSRGLYPPLAQNALPAGLLYTGLRGNSPPPPLRASAADQALLEEAWRSHGCLALEGRWESEEGGLLTVARVLGECRDYPQAAAPDAPEAAELQLPERSSTEAPTGETPPLDPQAPREAQDEPQAGPGAPAQP